jgi:hypothetical protein
MNNINKFFTYLQQFEWNSPQYIESVIQCIDDDDLLKTVDYKTLKEAFLAGEKLAIIIHDPACGYDHSDAIFIDNITRPACDYENTQPIGRFGPNLVNCMEDCMVLTIQGTINIKRFGITSGFDGMPSQFFENPLHPDITSSMHKLMEQFS